MQQEITKPFSRVMDARLIASVVATSIMSFSGVVVETAMNVTFPALMREFGVGTSTVQWMTTAYLLVLAAIIPTSAYLNRRFRTKRIFMAAMSLYILGIALGLTAQNFPWLLCGRIAEGMGTGVALPLMFNVIQEQAPKRSMGLMMGVGSLVTAMAPAVGPSLGGWLAETFGWRSIFACLLPLLLVGFVLGALTIRQSHPAKHDRFDLVGWLLLVMAFTSLVLAASEMGTGGPSSPIVLGLIAASATLLALFALHASHAETPLISLGTFRDSRFDLGLMALIGLQFIVLGLSFLLPNYSQLTLGHGPTEAGSILLPGCLLGAVMAPVSGRLLDAFGARRPILTGACAVLMACILLWLTAPSCETPMATCIYLLFAFGQGLMAGNTMTHALGGLADARKADGTAIINTLQQLAGALGTSVVTAVVATAQASAGVSASETRSALSAATANGTQVALALLVGVAALVLVAEVLSLCTHRDRT